MDKIRKIGLTLVSVCLWAIILVAALFAFTTLATKDTNSVASIAGFTPLMVASESMEPTFGTDDLIIIQNGIARTTKGLEANFAIAEIHFKVAHTQAIIGAHEILCHLIAGSFVGVNFRCSMRNVSISQKADTNIH